MRPQNPGRRSEELASSGQFSMALVTAGELIQSNREAFARRSGKYDPALFGRAASSGSGRCVVSDVLAVETPGYLRLTSTNEVRQTLALQRSHGPRGERFDRAEFCKTRGLADSLAVEELQAMPLQQLFDCTMVSVCEQSTQATHATATAVPSMHKTPKVPRLSVEQQELDGKVLQRMEQKLHFLKNPRYDGTNRNNARRLTAKPQTPPTLGEHSTLTTRPALAATPRPEVAQPLLIVEPSVVSITEYATGGQYCVKLCIRNAYT